ncbi:MAG: ABC transporter ATP-binding protein [Deltaproteobacteria bacterium]|nr:ABC transporter ATP-binding protein [Deltaproteobacteria bacterium]
MTLGVEALCAGYAGVPVLRQVSMRVQSGAAVVLLGHNGAGKSTLLRALFGLVAEASGRVWLDGEPVLGLTPAAIAARAVALVPQGQGVFPSLTVAENLRLGLFAAGVAAPSAEGKARLARVFHYLPALRELMERPAGLLSGGQQQMTSIARALVSRPKLLLLDEPSIGLAPAIVREVMRLVGQLSSQEGISVLMAEQNVRPALAVADRVYVMKSGAIVHESDPQALADVETLWRLF